MRQGTRVRAQDAWHQHGSQATIRHVHSSHSFPSKTYTFIKSSTYCYRLLRTRRSAVEEVQHFNYITAWNILLRRHYCMRAKISWLKQSPLLFLGHSVTCPYSWFLVLTCVLKRVRGDDFMYIKITYLCFCWFQVNMYSIVDPYPTCGSGSGSRPLWKWCIPEAIDIQTDVP